MTIRVLLADDNALFRNSLGRLLMNQPGIEVAGQAADGKLAIELARKLKPDVVLIDVRMPWVNGIEATQIIHRECPDIRIIGFSMNEGQAIMRAMRDAGATGYITKGCCVAELVAELRACSQAHGSSPRTEASPRCGTPGNVLGVNGRWDNGDHPLYGSTQKSEAS